MELYYAMNRIYGSDESGNILAEITFPSLDRYTVNISHTFVDGSLKGQGMGGRLVKAAADSFRRSGLKAVVTCDYAKHWFEKHPEYQDVLR